MLRSVAVLLLGSIFVISAGVTGAVAAATAASTKVTSITTTDESTLDRLFAKLKAAPDETAARKLEQEIWKFWTHPADRKLAELMKSALKARRDYAFDRALKILEQVTAGWPDYAEGWNQRATVYFHLEEYDKSLVYIAETLKREPRHFGSMAGRAVIRLRQGKAALGFQSIKAAMIYHPYIRERSFFPQFRE